VVKHDLVDELWLKIFPITLGMGKRLFAEGTIAAAFTLHEAKTSPSGVDVSQNTFRFSLRTPIERHRCRGLLLLFLA
jgi:dihydrofolate reductase